MSSAILLFVSSAISSVAPGSLELLELPRPTGPHGVGTRLEHWVDASRPELGTPDETDSRELVVQLWYPAEASARSEPAPYALLSLEYHEHGILDDVALERLESARAFAAARSSRVTATSSRS